MQNVQIDIQYVRRIRLVDDDGVPATDEYGDPVYKGYRTDPRQIACYDKLVRLYAHMSKMIPSEMAYYSKGAHLDTAADAGYSVMVLQEPAEGRWERLGRPMRS